MELSTDALIALASAVGTWAAVVGALLAVWAQNRAAARMMRAQLSIHLATQYDSEETQLARAHMASRLLLEPSAQGIDDSVLVFLENVSHLARRKLIDWEMVWNVFGSDIPYYWIALRHYVHRLREDLHDASLFEEMEALARVLSRPQRSPMGTPMPALDLNPTAVREFLRTESGRSPHRAGPRRVPVNRRTRTTASAGVAYSARE